MREIQAVVDTFRRSFKNHLNELKELARIPSVSFAGFPPQEVRRSAEYVAGLLEKTGLEKIQLLDVEGCHPYVYGERLRVPGAPTLLLYAHHDVQPIGREEFWKTSPFEPVEKEGPGGVRLYGRGTADDKAGVLIHVAAIESYLKSWGELPVNVKVLIEGEEEIGSVHLEKFLKSNRELLDADILVLTDTSNFDCGVPALTIALRGLVEFDIEVRALSKTIHSGMWGGPVPDPAMALSKLLAGLVDEKGRIAVPGVLDQVRPLSRDEESRMAKIPFNEKAFREASGMLPGAELLTEGPSPIAQIWRFPSLSVNAVQASSRKQAGNIICDVAWSRVTIRLVADMDPEKVRELVVADLRRRLPWGLQLEIKSDAANPPWAMEPEGEAFEAAMRSMEKAYGRKPIAMGCGGSIPFVRPFTEALRGAPALLIGVEDPYTNAHGENESLLISDFEKACVSQIYLFEELSRVAYGKK